LTPGDVGVILIPPLRPPSGLGRNRFTRRSVDVLPAASPRLSLPLDFTSPSTIPNSHTHTFPLHRRSVNIPDERRASR
jgi:hypothetical protein